MTSVAGAPPALIRTWRRIAIIAIIAGLSLTALLGIAVLFSGDFGETQARVLGTSLLVALFSVTVLCDIAVAGRAVSIVGYIGVAISLIAFVLGLILIWSEWGESTFEVVRWFAVAAIIAASISHACLLLLLANRQAAAVRIGLSITLAMIAAVALLACLPIASDGEIPGDSGDLYWRFFGMFAILDAVGTIVVPVIAIFLREPRVATPQAEANFVLPPELAHRVRGYAQYVHSDPNEIVAYAVAEHLDRHQPTVPVSLPDVLPPASPASPQGEQTTN